MIPNHTFTNTDPTVLTLLLSMSQQIQALNLKVDLLERRLKPLQDTQNFEKIYTEVPTEIQFNTPLTEKQLSKRNICFAGPQSERKTSLIAQVLNLRYRTTLLSTRYGQLLKQSRNQVFWEAITLNQDFSFYDSNHLRFFQSMDLVVLIFDQETDEIRHIASVLSYIVRKIIYVKIQCDQWNPGNKPYMDQLKQIQKYDYRCNQVIRVSYGRYEKIKQSLLPYQKQLNVKNCTLFMYKSPLNGEQLAKINICFIGLNAVGKTTLTNQLFGAYGLTGLGSTTKAATVVKELADRAFWDTPGINENFGFDHPHHLGFFQSLNIAVILFDRDIDEASLIVELISKIVPKVIYGRTKCDEWNSGMKSIEDQMKTDLEEIQRYDPKAKEVIPVGYGMYEKIRQALDLNC